ncbi:hypothetical protein, partial [Dysgonomonas sp. ZJ279]|uniref:hypothetical protein n=1 Tax=Dysgonomonas sp. ZJ279 TaxID=2709796 RepID=UPI001C876018
MNIHKGFDFSQLGGFPLNQQRLEYMQAAYTELSGALASVFNGNVILSGCIIAGLNVSDGWVVVNGEILPFLGSTTGTQTTFLVRETRTPILFKDGQNRNVQFSRFCQFGSGTGAIAWSSLTRLNSLLAISNHVNRVDNP